jgi:hypothetical protein
MNLLASQRRALNQIEKAQADDHPGLGPLLAIFTGLTGRAHAVSATRYQPACATQQKSQAK